MTIARRKPIPRKRATPRRVRSPRCSSRGCKRIARVGPVYVSVNTASVSFTEEGPLFCLTHAKKEADRLWAAPARDPEAECELRGTRLAPSDFGPDKIGATVTCGGPIQAAHGFPRRYLGTRWLALNRWLICAGHHRYYTDRWPEWVAVMRERLGDTVYDELDRLRRSWVGPVDWAAVLGELSQ